VDELYQQYLQDKNSVDHAWWEFFDDYQPTHTDGDARATPRATGTPPAPAIAGRRPTAQPPPLRCASPSPHPPGRRQRAPPRPESPQHRPLQRPASRATSLQRGPAQSRVPCARTRSSRCAAPPPAR
jgi:2-oxoglutarate dehydrogenase E1 component